MVFIVDRCSVKKRERESERVSGLCFGENKIFSVHIGKTHSKYCPVSILLRYMGEAKLSPTSDLLLFSPLGKTKSGYVLRSSKRSYSRCREVFKEALSLLGCDPKAYGMKSLRLAG